MPRLHGFLAVHDHRGGRDSSLLQPPDQLTDLPLHLLPLLLGMRGAAIQILVPGALPEVGAEAGPESHQVGARQLHAAPLAHLHAEKLTTTSTGGTQ